MRRWDWLAISIKGRRHTVRIKSGVERGVRKEYQRVIETVVVELIQ